MKNFLAHQEAQGTDILQLPTPITSTCSVHRAQLLFWPKQYGATPSRHHNEPHSSLHRTDKSFLETDPSQAQCIGACFCMVVAVAGCLKGGHLAQHSPCQLLTKARKLRNNSTTSLYSYYASLCGQEAPPPYSTKTGSPSIDATGITVGCL